MKLNLITLSIAFSTLFQCALFSQNTPTRPVCGTQAPGIEWDNWFNQQVEEYKANKAKKDVGPVTITIPVVVHVIHGGQTVGTFPNISANQIKSQIKVMNADFAGIGYNSAALASTGFSAVGAASTNINFCLAQFDPNGTALAEPGIDRVNYNDHSWQSPTVPATANALQSFIDGTVKPATIWDPSQYFNIWVTDVNSSAYLLGYATFPAGSSLTGLTSNFGNTSNDGIWIWAKAFGSTGTLDPTYNRGRTAVHETGHYLGLRHIGGDATNPAGDCTATDYCADTPPQKGGFGGGTNGQNYGAPSYPLHVNVCSSPYGDMFMNFMDYSDDVVLSMFSPDQNDRMQTALLVGSLRKFLSASSATQCVGMPSIVFADNQEGCVLGGSRLDFQNDTSVATTYTWSSSPSTGVVFNPSQNDANPVLTFPSPGNYTLTVASLNAIGWSTSTVEVVAYTCDGLADEKINSGFKASPNPASNEITLRFAEAISGAHLQVKFFGTQGISLLAEEKVNFSGNTLLVNTSSLAEGIYFMMVTVGDHTSSQRLLIRH